MSHSIARAYAFNLAQTLLVPIVVFQNDGQFGVMLASEYDGADATIIQELDPDELGLYGPNRDH